jgi:2-C-methyl-D-erythritol 4-phosphate cytidylyltransferase
VQTPQGFKTSLIKTAHNKAIKNTYTDDSSMVEELTDTKVYVIDGEYQNIKYKFKEDF